MFSVFIREYSDNKNIFRYIYIYYSTQMLQVCYNDFK